MSDLYFVMFNMEPIKGRITVTTDKERVLEEGWTKTKL